MEFFGNFLEFLGEFFGNFLEDFFGGIFLGEIFWEEVFLEGTFWEELQRRNSLFILLKLFEYERN